MRPRLDAVDSERLARTTRDQRRDANPLPLRSCLATACCSSGPSIQLPVGTRNRFWLGSQLRLAAELSAPARAPPYLRQG